MLRYHLATITGDHALQRTIRRLGTAAGAVTAFASSSAGFDVSAHPRIDLIVFDARDEDPTDKLLAALPADTKIVYLIAERLPLRIHLLKDERVVSLVHCDEALDEEEFICAVTKALRSDVFGLDKHLPWGVTTYSMVVRDYQAKGRALDILRQFARAADVSSTIRDRVLLVADELIMNALYHASHGPGGTSPPGSDLPNPVQVQYAASGSHVGVAVRDGGGNLLRSRIVEYAMRSQAFERDDTAGSSPGLLTAMKSVSTLIFNLDPGYSSEVAALIELDHAGARHVGARSLHIHVAAPPPPGAGDAALAQAALPVRPDPLPGRWLLIAIASVIGLGLLIALITG